MNREYNEIYNRVIVDVEMRVNDKIAVEIWDKINNEVSNVIFEGWEIWRRIGDQVMDQVKVIINEED